MLALAKIHTFYVMDFTVEANACLLDKQKFNALNAQFTLQVKVFEISQLGLLTQRCCFVQCRGGQESNFSVIHVSLRTESVG